MKTRRGAVVIGLMAGLAASGVAQAALWDRGGGLIYDDVLDVTWLQDASYAETSGYDVNGVMSWSRAMAWADQLTYGGFSNWRLPTVNPINGSAYDFNLSYDGSTDYSYNISAPGTVYAGGTGSELAYMYYNNLLGNEPAYNPDGSANPDWSLVVSPSFVDAATGETRAFQNLGSWFYWSGTEYALDPSVVAWGFLNHYGLQAGDFKVWGSGLAWAVRPGDVPLPGAGLLLASALVGLGWAHRRR